MNILGLNVTLEKKPTCEEVTEILENEINCRLVALIENDIKKVANDFKRFYLYLQIVKHLENNKTIKREHLLDKTSLRHFYNMKQIVDKLDIIEQAKLKRYNLKAEIVTSEATALKDIVFTQTF